MRREAIVTEVTSYRPDLPTPARGNLAGRAGFAMNGTQRRTHADYRRPNLLAARIPFGRQVWHFPLGPPVKLGRWSPQQHDVRSGSVPAGPCPTLNDAFSIDLPFPGVRRITLHGRLLRRSIAVRPGVRLTDGECLRCIVYGYPAPATTTVGVGQKGNLERCRQHMGIPVYFASSLRRGGGRCCWYRSTVVVQYLSWLMSL